MKNHTVYRGFSRNNSFGLLCAGEMHKEGISADTFMTKYPFYCMVLILQGQGVYEDDRGVRETLAPGMIVQRFTDRKHSIKIDPASRWHEVFTGLGILEFDDPAKQRDRAGDDFWKADIMYPQCNRTMDYLERLNIADPLRPVFSLPGSLPDKDFTQFGERLEEAARQTVPLLVGDCLGLFSRVACLGDRGRMGRSDPLSQARDLLESRLEERIPVMTLLKPVALSYAHLRERFKETHGTSPGQYRIGRRIEKACYCLTAEQLSPGETAFRLGYDDTSSFSKQFKKIMGLSPGEYVKKRVNVLD